MFYCWYGYITADLNTRQNVSHRVSWFGFRIKCVFDILSLDLSIKLVWQRVEAAGTSGKETGIWSHVLCVICLIERHFEKESCGLVCSFVLILQTTWCVNQIRIHSSVKSHFSHFPTPPHYLFWPPCFMHPVVCFTLHPSMHLCVINPSFCTSIFTLCRSCRRRAAACLQFNSKTHTSSVCACLH